MNTDRRARVNQIFSLGPPPMIGIHWVNFILNPATSEENLTISPHSTNIISCKSSSLCAYLFADSFVRFKNLFLPCVHQPQLVFHIPTLPTF